jgi:hypothetical protein
MQQQQQQHQQQQQQQQQLQWEFILLTPPNQRPTMDAKHPEMYKVVFQS